VLPMVVSGGLVSGRSLVACCPWLNVVAWFLVEVWYRAAHAWLNVIARSLVEFW
jgi:hypothetical protein